MKEKYFYSSYIPKNLEKISCSVCGGQGFRLLAKENHLDIVRCTQCDFVLVNPRPCRSDLRDFYEEYYPDEEGLPESWGGEMSAIFRSAYEDVIAVRNGGSILDIGSSYGHFLGQFDSTCWKATGIDPSSQAIGYCRENYPHITAYAANFEDVELRPGEFDVIASFYVLEHVFDPRSVVERIYALLREDGMAVIRIPYTRPFFWAAKLLGRPLMYAPMHLNDFSPEQFQQMCRSIGFSRVEATIGSSRSSTDIVEKMGATVFGGMGRAYELLSSGDSLFPYAGAYTYRLNK